MPNYKLRHKTARIGAYIPLLEAKIYGFDGKPQSYNVNTFQEIGWTDPFPGPLNILKGKFMMPSLEVEDFNRFLRESKTKNKNIRCQDFLPATKRFDIRLSKAEFS